jgi:hypothetical protein
MPQMLIAAGGCEVAGQHLHGGGLAGAVRSQQTEHFPRFSSSVMSLTADGCRIYGLKRWRYRRSVFPIRHFS